MEITDNHIDRGYGAAWRTEKRLFTTTVAPRGPAPAQQLHPMHKYEHFDSFPRQYEPSTRPPLQQKIFTTTP